MGRNLRRSVAISAFPIQQPIDQDVEVDVGDIVPVDFLEDTNRIRTCDLLDLKSYGIFVQ